MRGTAKEIKEFLREKGIDTKDIRVSTKNSINVKLLDPKLDYAKINELVTEEYESYQRDESTGEILGGGNTFVHVEFDYDLTKQVSDELQGTIPPFLAGCAGNWSIPSLVRHYLESQPLEYNIHIVKRAIKEALYLYIKTNESDLKEITITGWN